MHLNQKIIKPKIGLLELAKSLGSISSACKAMDIVETVITDLKNCMKLVAKKRYMKLVAESQ